MGTLYRRKHALCTTCARIVQTTAARRACDAAGHVIEIRESPTWWVKYYQGGRPVRESTETDKETVARRILRAREGDVEHGIPITPKMGRVTFDEAAADLDNDYRVNRRRSLSAVQRHIKKHLTPFFGGRRMAGITSAAIRAYIAARLEAKASNATINRELAALKRMFALAVRDGKLHRVLPIPLLRENNVRSGFFERPAFEAVRQHLPPELRPVVTFAYVTGWRVKSEVLPLQWRQVDLQAGTVRLDPGTTKNGEGRLFHLGMVDELREAIEAQRRGTEDLQRTRGEIIPWVFHRAGEPIRDFRRAWKTTCKATGYPGRIPHDFRRTAVRNLERAGVPRSAAMRMVGHRTESMYRRYAIVEENDLREAALRLNALTGTKPGTNAGRAVSGSG